MVPLDVERSSCPAQLPAAIVSSADAGSVKKQAVVFPLDNVMDAPPPPRVVLRPLTNTQSPETIWGSNRAGKTLSRRIRTLAVNSRRAGLARTGKKAPAKGLQSLSSNPHWKTNRLPRKPFESCS